jgi:hypothetical protein
MVLSGIREYHDVIATNTGGSWSTYVAIRDRIQGGSLVWNSSIGVSKDAYDEIVTAIIQINNIVVANKAPADVPGMLNAAEQELSRRLGGQ